MDKLCYHKKMWHQNHSLISHSRMINKEAVLLTVALCSVVQEIRAELFFYSHQKRFFIFIHILYCPILWIFNSCSYFKFIKTYFNFNFQFRYQIQRNGRTTTLFKMQKNTWRYFNAFMHTWFVPSMCCW